MKHDDRDDWLTLARELRTALHAVIPAVPKMRGDHIDALVVALRGALQLHCDILLMATRLESDRRKLERYFDRGDDDDSD